jgi:hypothetical protein
MKKTQCLSQMRSLILMSSHALVKRRILTCKLQSMKEIKKVSTHIESRRMQKKLTKDKRLKDAMKLSRCSSELIKILWSKLG